MARHFHYFIDQALAPATPKLPAVRLPRARAEVPGVVAVPHAEVTRSEDGHYHYNVPTRGGPMFGGLGGNAQGCGYDEGTSEGARKAWRTRKGGGGGKKKPPPLVGTGTSKKPAPPVERTPIKSQIGKMAEQGGRPTARSKGSVEGKIKQTVGVGRGGRYPNERARFQPKPLTAQQAGPEGARREAIASGHQERRKELQGLRAKHKSGEQLTAQEHARMTRLHKIYGG